MKGKKSHYNSRQRPEKKASAPKSIENKSENKTDNTRTEQNPTTKENKMPPSRIGKEGNWTKPEKISLAQLIVNSLLACFTLSLLWVGYKQSVSAEKSAIAAKKAIEISEKNTQVQIKAIKDQFEVENRPFLVIRDAKNIGVNKVTVITVTGKNYGRYPTKIIGYRTFGYFRSEISESDSKLDTDKLKEGILKSEWGNLLSGFYISTEQQDFNLFIFNMPENMTIEKMAREKTTLAYCFEVVYEDLITHKKYKLTEVLHSMITVYNPITKSAQSQGGVTFMDDVPFDGKF